MPSTLTSTADMTCQSQSLKIQEFSPADCFVLERELTSR